MKRKSNSLTRSSKTYLDKKGYSRFKDSDKPVHRSVAELKLGRSLKSGEVVHHKNRNKHDNSFGNLHVFGSQNEHWKAHKQDAKKYGLVYSMIGKKSKSK
jgi:hypothetical protein